jgi:hypothetical protein
MPSSQRTCHEVLDREATLAWAVLRQLAMRVAIDERTDRDGSSLLRGVLVLPRRYSPRVGTGSYPCGASRLAGQRERGREFRIVRATDILRDPSMPAAPCAGVAA